MKEPIKPGHYEDLSNDDYHSDPAISRSHLMKMRKTPKHYWYEYINPNYIKPASQEALIFGSAFHTFLLEPKKFEDEYFVMPDLDLRTKAGKEFKKAILEQNPGKIFLSQDQFFKLCHMSNAIVALPEARKLIGGCIEHSLFWQDKETGLMCKVRPDVWFAHMVVDLKSSKDLSSHSYKMSAYNFGYHIQAAMIQTAFKEVFGIDMNDFLFLGCEKDEPFSVSVDIMSSEFIDLGHQEFRHYLNLLAECKSTNTWPSYGVRDLKAPNFTKFGVIENE
jgi:hypothetical protein